jgi:hypothetical protein
MAIGIQGAIKVLLTLGRLHISTGDVATEAQKESRGHMLAKKIKNVTWMKGG